MSEMNMLEPNWYNLCMLQQARADAAEARVKELEKQLQQTEEHLHPLLAKAHMRIKELEAERDDLLRLGNNHK